MSNAAREDLQNDAIADWITLYYKWHSLASGIAAGRNLHLLYSRSVSLIGSNMYEHHNWATPILKSAFDQGSGSSIRINFCNYRLKPWQLRSRLNVWRGVKIVIDVRSLTAVTHNCLSSRVTRLRFARLVELLNQAGSTFSFIASLHDMKILGAYTLSTLNPSSFQIFQPTDALQKNDGTRVERRPPQNSLQLFISPDGTVYPCAAFIGKHSAQIGSIFKPFDPAILSDPRVLDLLNFTLPGPEVL